MEFDDTEVVEEEFLGAHHVADGDEGKQNAVRAAGFGVGRGRAGGPLATAEDVGADDEEAAGVDGFAGADEVVPPAGFFVGRGVPTGAVVIAAESMANEDGVVAGGVQRAVGFVAELEAGNALAAAEGERLRVDEISGRYEADLAGREVPRRGFRAGCGWQRVDVVSHRLKDSTRSKSARQVSRWVMTRGVRR